MNKPMTAEQIRFELADAYVDKLIDRLFEDKDSGHYVAGYLGRMIADAASRDDELFESLEMHSDLFPRKK